MLKITNTNQYKTCEDDGYHLFFRKEDGLTLRWGKTKDDDPPWAPTVEIADIEISTGDCLGRGCRGLCYKFNGGGPSKHMSLDTYKEIIRKLGPGLTQVALGITNIYSNPDFFEMLRWSKEGASVIANYTCHGLDVDQKAADWTAKYCGAVAVSIVNKEKTYDAVKMFVDAGVKQVNIHFVLHDENYEGGEVFQVIDECAQDKRLTKLNALVLLAFKDKQKTGIYHPVTDVDKYRKILQYAEKRGVRLGLDSCSGPIYLKVVADSNDRDKLASVVETCCSARFSCYASVDATYFPCSFLENEEESGWGTGINILERDDFYRDIWRSERVEKWRQHVIGCGNDRCPCNYFNK
jgi:hypothetical protein